MKMPPCDHDECGVTLCKKEKKPLQESEVYSAYLDSDGALHLYDKNENPLEGWPRSWPEEIRSVKTFLESRQIHYVNKPRGQSLLDKVAAEILQKPN